LVGRRVGANPKTDPERFEDFSIAKIQMREKCFMNDVNLWRRWDVWGKRPKNARKDKTAVFLG
jgi:hypothetical protein